MPWALNKRIAVVTGVSGSIGRAVTQRLLDCGVTVFGTSRTTSLDELDALKESFDRRALGTKTDEGCITTTKSEIPRPRDVNVQPLSAPLAGIVSCDMLSEKSCDEAIKKIMIQMSSKDAILKDAVIAPPRIDLFVNCAGITQNKLLARTSQDDLTNMYLTNTVAPVMFAKSILRHGNMLSNKGGCLIALGSVVGEDGNAGQVAYAASKGALTSSWKSLAKEFGGRGIRFNVVSPGLVQSTMAESISEEKKQQWASQSALGRLVTPEEVADAVLACAANSGITGQVIRVDAGMKY